MSVDNDDEDHLPGEVYHVEKILAHGDFYTGQWCDHLPQGQGKYLWIDGCMYVGEWEKGKTNGNGMFSWPSGATYEGEFKNGYMDGVGTYIGSSGDTYKGSWVMNMKHGKGTKSYPNGDYYDGEWRKEYQDGHGRYRWRKGNYYIGQWKNGKFSGNGSMMWTDGNRYDGCWEDGVPKGNGTFRWPDGSFYAGVWSKDQKEQSGTYYPAGSTSSGHKDWDPQEVPSSVLKDCVVYPCEDVPVYPSEKRLNLPEMMTMLQSVSKKGSDGGRTRWMSADARVNSYGSEEFRRNSDVDRRTRDGFESSGSFQFEESVSRGNKPPNLRLKPPKRQGETISKGHKNYDLMLNLQLGIRHSVGRPAPSASLDLKPSAFKEAWHSKGRPVKVVAVCGSLLKGSYNRGLIRAAIELSKGAIEGIEIEDVDIAALPMLNTDLEEDGRFPAEVEEFRRKIEEADSVLFASPEYNYSVTGNLLFFFFFCF